MLQSLIGATTTFLFILCLIATTSQVNAQKQIASLANPSTEARTNATAGNGTPDAFTIVAEFVAAEAKVREALNQHAFKRDVVLQTIGPNGEVTGEYIRNSQFVFDDRGRRIERVLFHPKSTISEMRITREDIQDLSNGQLLGIDIAEATKYQLTYAGLETVESVQLYALDVTPRVQPDPNHMSERFFIGRVWLDPATFQIVKLKGIIEPQGKQRFPVFETWRAPIKNALAFPVRTEADDVLHFKTSDVHYRIKVRYYDYKLFASKVSVTELDEPVPETEGNREKSSPETKFAPPPPPRVPAPTEARPKADVPAAKPTSASGITWAAKTPSCATNRSAPPIGPYHWPADKEVKVYFWRNMFTPEQRDALLEAMATWTSATAETGSGIKFSDAGETDRRMGCSGCLTVGRKEIYKQDKHHYAFFHPMKEEGGVLVSAWIDLDFGITNPKALKGFMVHELAHGLGLWDCTTCKKKLTIMNGFPGINKDNGLLMPSVCDLATVRDIYQEERQLAAARTATGREPGVVRTGAAAAARSNSNDTIFAILNEPRPSGVGIATRASDDERTRPGFLPSSFPALNPSIESQHTARAAAGAADSSQSGESPNIPAPANFMMFTFGKGRPNFAPLRLLEPRFGKAPFFGNYFRSSASIIQ